MKNPSKTSGGSRQDNFFGTCEGCKSICCRGARPPLTLGRISTIKEYLLANNIGIEEPFERREYSFPKENSDEYCIFFDTTTKRCMIHASKPETCVAGPITFDINIDRRTVEWYLKTKKICRLAGELYHNKDKLREHMKSAKMEIRSLIRDLSKKELLAILSIDEPDTFKIGEDRLDPEILEKLQSVP